ncbi:MAG: LPS export ABC transporter periplasmic protein LptC [Proteobacteria bacterium]|nr:LPS export ABC transporter periplasmic protein LptC [Pseudomonadota bacterium]
MPQSATYSRIVTFSKLVLPLAALVVLSLMFLFSGRPDPNQALPLATQSADGQLGQQGMTNPHFAMVTGSGRTLELIASSAEPVALDANQIFATDVMARITRLMGARDQITADQALWNSQTTDTQLTGNIVATTPEGYRLDTEELSINAASGDIVAPQAVLITSDEIRLEAGQMAITGPSDHQVVHFQGGVRLLYDGK